MASLRSSLFAVIFSLAAVPAWAGSSAISRQLEKVAKSLTKDYQAKRSGQTDVSLAAFPFSSSKALARRGVGFAVSELLMPHFVKTPIFDVVERAALIKVMEEQKLQVTGAVDSNTAVRVGKLIGAQVLLLGSVEKLGGSYHVNARLVDAESGKVIVVAYQELAAVLFEEEARHHFAPIPEKQKIGFYFLYNFRRNSNNLPSQPVANISNSPYTYDRTLTPHSFNLGLLGGGIRYYPFEHWMLDLSVAVQTAEIEAASVDNPANAFPGHTMVRKTMIVRANVNWVTPIWASWRGIVGVGMSNFSSEPSGATFKTATVPMIRVGLEYKIQRRTALGFFLNYEFINMAGFPRDYYPPYGQLPNKTPVFKFNKLSFEPTIAIYF